MPNGALRVLVGLAGAGVVAAATYANIQHIGGLDAKDAPLIIALAVLLIVGMAFAMVMWIEKRTAQAVVLGICLLSGEVYWALLNAEREVTDREIRSYPVTEARQARADATAKLKQAENALAEVPMTSQRLSEALAAKRAADEAVLAKSAEMGCRVNCKDLLQGQVDEASREVDAARLELETGKIAAAANLAAARADLSKLPDPPSATALPDRIGMAPWVWDLILAGLRTTCVVGGSLAIGFAIHPRKSRTETSRLAAKELTAARAQRLEPVPRPAALTHSMDAPSRRDHVSKFLKDTIQPDPTGSLSLKALAARYPSWCRSEPLPSEELGEELRAIFKALGLRCEPAGRDIIIRGASFMEAIAAPTALTA